MACEHLKIFEEEALNYSTPLFKWKCVKCGVFAIETNLYTYIYNEDLKTVLKTIGEKSD